MITEQKLSQVGKEQYIAFVRLIGTVVAHKEHRKENAETEPEKIWLGDEPDALSEIISKFDPDDDPRFIRIPGVKIDALWGSSENDGWVKWEQSISWLVDDYVLKDFMSQFGKHERMGNHTVASSLENALDFQKLLDGTTDRMNMRYWDVLVIPRMSATEIEQYVDEVRSIGATKPKSPTQAFEKSGKEVENEKVEIVIDAEKGIYRKDNRKKLYPIYGARKEYVIAIYKNNGSTMQELQKIGNQSQSVISRGITEINSSVAEKLGVRGDLIMKNKTAGKYMLNKENFSFTDSRHVE